MTALDKSAEFNETRHDVDINFLLLLFPINFHYSNITLEKGCYHHYSNTSTIQSSVWKAYQRIELCPE